MPTKQKTVFGRIKIEKAQSDVVKLESGITLRLARDANGGVEAVDVLSGMTLLWHADADQLVQAAKVIETIDDGKKFMCLSHGSFETRGSRQNPTCSRCFGESITAAQAAIRNGEARQEEEDQ